MLSPIFQSETKLTMGREERGKVLNDTENEPHTLSSSTALRTQLF